MSFTSLVRRRRHFVPLALLTLSIGGCVSADGEVDVDATTESTLTSRQLFARYELAETPDGIVAFASNAEKASGPVTVLQRVGRPDESFAVLANAGLPRGDIPWASDAAGRLYKLGGEWVSQRQELHVTLVRVTLARSSEGSLSARTETLWSTSAPATPSGAGISLPSLAVADDGTTYIAFGRAAPKSGEASPFVLVACPATAGSPGGCTEETLLAQDTRAHTGSVAVAVDGDGVLVALRRASTSTIELLTGRPGAMVPSATLSDPAYALADLYVARRGARTVLGAHGSSLTLLERDAGGSWQKKGALRSQIRRGARTELAVTSDGVVVTSFPSLDPVRLGRVYREVDGFKGQDLSPEQWRGSVQLAGGERFFVGEKSPMGFREPRYGTTRGTALHFVDPARGAGSLELGRDPCFWSGRREQGEGEHATGSPTGSYVPTPTESMAPWFSDWKFTPRPASPAPAVADLVVPAGTVRTIAAGTCFRGTSISGEGELRLEGTADRPVHLLGTRVAVRTVHATYAHFDAVPGGLSPTLDAGIGEEGFSGTPYDPRTPSISGSLDHVSWRSDVPSRVALLAWGVPREVSNLAPRTFTIMNSDFGPVAGDVFSFAKPVELRVENSTFHDIDGTALAMKNHGFNRSKLEIKTTRFERVRGAVRVSSVSDDQRTAALRAMGASDPDRAALAGALATAVSIEDVTVADRWSRPARPGIDAERFPGIFLATATGRLDRVTVRDAESDGIRLAQAGELTLAHATVASNGRHGVRVEAQPPAGLGPCREDAAAVKFGPPPVAYPPDPIIEDSVIELNAAAGIHVSGPHIPMVVHRNRIGDNRLAGYVVENGRGLSKGRPDTACGPRGYRSDAEVELPMSPLTRLDHNDLVGNGADDARLALRSEHVLGVLPATDNYWGWSAAPSVSCVGVCAVAPALANPARRDVCFDEAYYLAQNADVAAVVARGDFASGREHFERHGRGEGRPACPPGP